MVFFWFIDNTDEWGIWIIIDIQVFANVVFTWLQGWKIPAKVTEDDDVRLISKADGVASLGEDEKFIIEEARGRLLSLERNIERRYLKPPFAKG